MIGIDCSGQRHSFSVGWWSERDWSAFAGITDMMTRTRWKALIPVACSFAKIHQISGHAPASQLYTFVDSNGMGSHCQHLKWLGDWINDGMVASGGMQPAGGLMSSATKSRCLPRRKPHYPQADTRSSSWMRQTGSFPPIPRPPQGSRKADTHRSSHCRDTCPSPVRIGVRTWHQLSE